MRFTIQIHGVQGLVGSHAQVINLASAQCLDGHLNEGSHAWWGFQFKGGDDADFVVVTDGVTFAEIDDGSRSHKSGAV